MIQARISQLKNQLSRYLRRVQEGEEIEILDRDHPVARVVPISGRDRAMASARLQQMARDGLVQPGSGKLVSVLLTKPPGKGSQVLEALLEERENR